MYLLRVIYVSLLFRLVWTYLLFNYNRDLHLWCNILIFVFEEKNINPIGGAGITFRLTEWLLHIFNLLRNSYKTSRLFLWSQENSSNLSEDLRYELYLQFSWEDVQKKSDIDLGQTFITSDFIKRNIIIFFWIFIQV